MTGYPLSRPNMDTVYNFFLNGIFKFAFFNNNSILGVHIVSGLGQEEGYTVKYTPSPEGVSEGTPEGEGVYLTVYPESIPNEQTFCDLLTYLHLFYRIFHAIRTNKCYFFSSI